jgi:hypothetical protein
MYGDGLTYGECMVIQITEQQLREIVNVSSKTLVGQICKRLEILALQDLTGGKKDILIKELIKEHIYENARSQLFCILSTAKGLDTFQLDIIKQNEVK